MGAERGITVAGCIPVNLYIMSRGRAGKVTTLASIPGAWLKNTWLVVNEADFGAYAKAYLGHPVGIIKAPSHITNYSQKFQWILDGLPFTPSPTRAIGHYDTGWSAGVFGLVNDKAVILDDDLVFSERAIGVNGPTGSLLTIKPEHNKVLEKMFAQMEALLDEYPLVSVHPRAMGHAAPPGHVENGRIICVQGINRRLIGPVRVDDFPILADVRLNLTLLGRGDKNAIITDFFQDHGPCQAPGGCSIYRTPEMQEACIDDLVRRWPNHVRKVIRKPKVAKWLGDERVEYVAQWKRLQRDAPDRR